MITTFADETPIGQTDYSGIERLRGLSNGDVVFTDADGTSTTQIVNGHTITTRNVTDYISNGTADGTVPMTGYTGASPEWGGATSAELNGNLIFADATSGLWSLNETTGVAVNLVNSSTGVSAVAEAGGEVFFTLGTLGALDGQNQLWTTDGTTAGTHLVETFADNTPDDQTDNSGIYGLIGLSNGDVAFTELDGTSITIMNNVTTQSISKTTVYISDGTEAGTVPGDSNGTPMFGFGSSAEVSVQCFLAGTRIRTRGGEAAVDTLQIGDEVETLMDGYQPIRRIRRWTASSDQYENPQAVWPVLIQAHAFAPQQPGRDLWLSPDHAIFVDNVLIPIRYLVNGGSIVQHESNSMVYFHVELPWHAVIFAEDLPCESYLATAESRALFPWADPARDRPTSLAVAWEGTACAPLVLTGPRLVAARGSLMRDAGNWQNGLFHRSISTPAICPGP